VLWYTKIEEKDANLGHPYRLFVPIVLYLPVGIEQSGKKVFDTILLVCPLEALLLGLK
jgi:hypothetical protein